MNSILYTIKKLIGLEPDYNAFDESIIAFINGAFATLQQWALVRLHHFGFKMERRLGTIGLEMHLLSRKRRAMCICMFENYSTPHLALL